MGSWGDVNAALNRLVREGVITGFRTNLADPDRGPDLRITATAPVVLDTKASGYDPAAVEQVRRTILDRLDHAGREPTGDDRGRTARGGAVVHQYWRMAKVRFGTEVVERRSPPRMKAGGDVCDEFY